MAFREIRMVDVKEILRRWQSGQAQREIARGTGVDRKTVQRYVEQAVAAGVASDQSLSDEVVHVVAYGVRSRAAPEVSAPWQALLPHRMQIEAWLKQSRPLRLTKVHTLLERQGVTCSYATLRRFAMAELGWHGVEPTVRVDDPPPAVEAQVDFGQMGFLVDAETEKRRMLWALIITLCFSRYMFVWPLFRQTTAAVCEGLDEAWKFFGGMTKTIVPDNTRAMIFAADPLTPMLVAAFTDYAQARGLFVDPARVRRPKDKARVENQVPYVRENWFAGEKFTGLDDARRSARHWSSETAGRRIHGTTKRVPREVFEAEERPEMLPAPTEAFDVPVWTDAVVHTDHHIQVLSALYSVPTRFLRKQVRVRADSQVVRIYLGTELIKTHVRMPPGGRATDPSDYPQGKSVYALRDINALENKAKELGHHIGLYAARLLSGPLPWARMRQVYALLGLCEKHGAGRVESLCQSALAFDVLDVGRLKKMLQSAPRPADLDGSPGKVVPLHPPRFARPAEQFRTVARGSGKEGA